MSTVVLSGGVGAARFLSGLVQAMDEGEITVISNTGDDGIFFGLYVSPDIDTVLYTLAGLVNPKTGWGVANDTFATLGELQALGNSAWFNLGDRDFATHIYRTMLLRQGETLSTATARLAEARGLRCTVLPMSDDRVETQFETNEGLLPFQEYMVKHHCQVDVSGIRFVGADTARPAPGVVEAIRLAERIIIAPSNPLISIGTILAVKEIRAAMQEAKDRVVAISPIVGGSAIKGPAAKLMQGLGYEASAAGVAKIYRPFAEYMVIDRQDEVLLPEIEALGMRVIATDTIMASSQRKKALAQAALDLFPQTH